MNVNTKLNVNDKAYVLSYNEVREVEIEEIIITISKGAISTQYIIDIDIRPRLSQSRYSDSEIFETKQQLLDSL